jgi:hypothetical protein
MDDQEIIDIEQTFKETKIIAIKHIMLSLCYAFQWFTDLSVKIKFDNFTVKIIKI